MNLGRRDFLAVSGTAAAAALVAGFFSKSTFAGGVSNESASDRAGLAVNDATLHFLNRISWGATAADYDRAVKLGIPAYLDEQLNPDAIKDVLADRLVKKNKLLIADRFALLTKKNGGDQAHIALVQGMLQRAVFSQRQLLERMVEFWSDTSIFTARTWKSTACNFNVRRYARTRWETSLHSSPRRQKSRRCCFF